MAVVEETAYPTNEKANVTQTECNAMKRLVQILVGGVFGEEVGGLNGHEGQDQAATEEDGAAHD